MRKIINIVGVGERKQGVGKASGRPYDFTPISFTYEDRFTNGLKAASVNLSQDCCPPGYEPFVGESVEVFMREDYKTGRIYIDGVC